MTTIFIADDHPMILTALQTLLSDTEFEVIGSASSGTEALDGIARLNPDIVLLDVRMPAGSGVDALRNIRGEGEARKVILLTASLSDSALLDATQLDVNGIVLKNADPAFLLDCLETVRDGGTWVDPELKERVGDLESKRAARASLAPRERELIALVRQGLRNREIAEKLGVTEGTVKVYLHSIFDKLQIANRTELAIRADEFVSHD